MTASLHLVYNACEGKYTLPNCDAAHFLSRPVADTMFVRTKKETPLMVMETLPPGTVLSGRYRIERVLGSGGFGHVYLSVDIRTNQQYAIKEYLVAGSSGKAQLEHEARVLSQLHHPNLPAFQDAFDERGRYYIVLGYIEGSDLTDFIRLVRQRNEVVPLARIMTWIISICDAVTFLHSQNPPVIHRDIKPDNIRITPDGTAILVDLGNAKAAADGARTLFFIRHQGTPGYAPLEQYPGGSGTDTRSDVYALGGTLYFALTTHEPPSVSTRNQSIQQGLPDWPSLQEQLAHNPPETSTEPGGGRQFRLGVTKPAKPAPRHSKHLAQLGTLPPELLERLNTIIKQAMAMKPKERYQSIADMSNDLKLVLAALPSSAQLPTTGSSRPVDPHSTQPDLPLLFETIQSAQATTDQASRDTSATSATPPSQPSAAPPSTVRCPQCNAEVRRQATFCPQCGSPLVNVPEKNVAPTPPSATTTPPFTPLNILNPTQGNDKAMPGASAEPTLVVRPKFPLSTPNPAGTPKQAPPVSPASLPPTAAQNMVRFQSKPPAQDMIFSPAPQQFPPKPFIQPSASTSVGMPQGKQASSAASNMQPANIAASSETPKILYFVVIVLIVALLIVAIIFLMKVGHRSSSSNSDQHYAVMTQVCTYERNVSLCVTSTAPSTHTGLWTRRSGVPATVSISERMVGSGIRHTPGDHWDWLT
jgi:serine/threonine protein kinase